MGTRVVSVALERFVFELPQPIVSARGAWQRREGVLLRLHDEAGRVGVGEASPLPGYSADTLEACVAQLEAWAATRDAARVMPAAPAARFALETALAELDAQARGVSLAAALGGGADAESRVLLESALVTDLAGARVALARGVRTLKVKIGVADAWERELAFLRELRVAMGPELALRLDAGGGFAALAPEVLHARLAALAAFVPEFIEEPVSGAALAGLRAGPVPLAADESLQDAALWPALAASCRVLVLKPTTLGLARCLELGREAAARGLAVVVTHTFDGPVARAAATALARALPGRVLACALTLPAPADSVRAPLSVRAAAAEAPARPALLAGGHTFTYAQLAQLADGVAAPAQGAAFVPIVADNRVETVATILALLDRRVPALLVHPRLTEPERAALLASAAGQTPTPGTAAIIFTSGTTGRARGALLSHDALVAAAAASAVQLGFTADDRWMACMPLAHVGGLSILTRCLLARACVVLEPRFDAARLPAALLEHRVTLLSLVPTMLARLLDEHPSWTPPAHLRAVLLGGAGSPARLLAQAAERGVPVVTSYGLTEACTQVVTAGRLLPGVELRITAPEGSIQVRGPMLMSGYLGEPPLVPGAWFDTGDLGELDDEGRLQVHARRTDLIVTGGENVYPAEVEDALAAGPGVASACVFGVPDERWGQLVAAALVAAAGAASDDAALAALAAHLAARLAVHKRPRLVAFVNALPTHASGKLDRGAAARLFTDRLRPLVF